MVEFGVAKVLVNRRAELLNCMKKASLACLKFSEVGTA